MPITASASTHCASCSGGGGHASNRATMVAIPAMTPIVVNPSKRMLISLLGFSSRISSAATPTFGKTTARRTKVDVADVAFSMGGGINCDPRSSEIVAVYVDAAPMERI